MGLHDRRQKKAARRRHSALLAAAEQAIHLQLLHGNGMRPEPDKVVALAFAMFAIRLDLDEAREYLNAALAERGYPLLDEEAGQ
ncbi:hypothetical protein SALBM135S_00868 [Streptomyces alboniger]